MKNKNFYFKTFLLISITALLAFSSVIFLSGCLSSGIPEITLTEKGEAVSLQNTITVSGTGTKKLLPDEAFIDISVITEKPTTQEAVDENSRLSEQMINEIKKISAENLTLQTISYELTPLYDYSKENEPPEIYAYRVVSTIEAKTTELEKMGEIIAKATEAGAGTISSVGFDLTDSTGRTAKNDALAAATTDANDKAIAIANAMGLKIDSVAYISESETVLPGPFFMAQERLDDLKAEQVAAPEILPQEIEVTATISVVYVFVK